MEPSSNFDNFPFYTPMSNFQSEEESSGTSSSMYSDSNASGPGGTAPKKQTTATAKVPYGRKRSCWKKKHTNEAVQKPVRAPKKSVGEAGVITCAICKIQRYYKFIKQTKKFGLPSCEPCRKFISFNIVYAKNGDSVSYTCTKKGPKNCLLSETFNDGVPKTKKDALSNMRCKACWLGMCLEKYRMPINLRESLLKFIADDKIPGFPTSDTEYDAPEYEPVAKRKAPTNVEVKPSCLKVLCDNYLKKDGLNEALRDKKKLVILRIKL